MLSISPEQVRIWLENSSQFHLRRVHYPGMTIYEIFDAVNNRMVMEIGQEDEEEFLAVMAQVHGTKKPELLIENML